MHESTSCLPLERSTPLRIESSPKALHLHTNALLRIVSVLLHILTVPLKPQDRRSELVTCMRLLVLPARVESSFEIESRNTILKRTPSPFTVYCSHT